MLQDVRDVGWYLPLDAWKTDQSLSACSAVKDIYMGLTSSAPCIPWCLMNNTNGGWGVGGNWCKMDSDESPVLIAWIAL